MVFIWGSALPTRLRILKRLVLDLVHNLNTVSAVPTRTRVLKVRCVAAAIEIPPSFSDADPHEDTERGLAESGRLPHPAFQPIRPDPTQGTASGAMRSP